MTLHLESVDRYMEQRFGKPDYSRTFFNFNNGFYYTPLGNHRLWRLDKQIKGSKAYSTRGNHEQTRR
jgi:hypothetical protein